MGWQPPAVGSRATLTRTFTHDDVETFAVLSGDRNPLHFDAAIRREHARRRPGGPGWPDHGTLQHDRRHGPPGTRERVPPPGMGLPGAGLHRRHGHRRGRSHATPARTSPSRDSPAWLVVPTGRRSCAGRASSTRCSRIRSDPIRAGAQLCPSAFTCALAPVRIGSPWPTSSVSKCRSPSLTTVAFAAAASSVNWGLEPARVPPTVPRASPATRMPPSRRGPRCGRRCGRASRRCAARRRCRRRPGRVSVRGAVIVGQVGGAGIPVAPVAAVRTASMLPRGRRACGSG